MRQVLVLRPEPGASETVRRARELGLDAVSVPLFRVVPLDWEPPEPSAFDGVLLTSANAVLRGGEGLKQLRGLKVYAIGQATGDAARQAGFDVAAIGDSGVDRLLDSMEPDLRLLHLCGADRREPHLPRQTIIAVPVYESREIDAPDLSIPASCVALIHSPRAGRRFRDLIDHHESMAIAAISRAAAEAVGSGWEEVRVADQPTDQALLALAASLCNKPHPQ